MATIITYGNSNNAFDGIGPTPFVQRSFDRISFGEYYGTIERLTLNGQLTGTNCYTLQELIDQQNLLTRRFARDFQQLEILEDSVAIYTKPFTVVKGITWNESRYYNYLEYQLNLECYPQQYFSGSNFGVTDPNHELNFEENDDGTVTINHEISARGFNTSAGATNALTNAYSFVRGFTGLTNFVTPQFIAGPVAPTLTQIEENVDRFNARYAVKETYLYSTGDPISGLLRYTMTYQSGVNEGLSTVGLQGSVEMGKTGTLVTLRNRYQTLKPYNIAASGYYQSCSQTGLNPEYLSSGIVEDSLNKRLEFNIAFDDDTRPTTSFDYNTSIQTDFLTDVSTVNFEGNVRARGDIQTRWNRVSGFYSTLNPFTTANSGYLRYGLAYPLNPKPISSGVIFNQFAGEINVTTQFDNRDIPPVNFDKFDLAISVNPSIHRYASEPLISNTVSGYWVSDMGFNKRAQLSIDGNCQLSAGIGQAAGLATLKTILDGVRTAYVTGSRKLLEKNSFTLGNAANSGKISYGVGYSAEDDEFKIS